MSNHRTQDNNKCKNGKGGGDNIYIESGQMKLKLSIERPDYETGRIVVTRFYFLR